MKLPQFVSASAVLLLTWLAVTFFRDVPPQRYQKLDKFPSLSAETGKTRGIAPIHSGETSVTQLSVSH